MSSSDLRARDGSRLMNPVHSTAAIKKRQQNEDAWLVKQAPLQIVRNSSCYSMKEVQDQMTASEQRKQKAKLREPNDSNEDAQIDDFEIIQRSNKSPDTRQLTKSDIEFIVQQSCNQYFKNINEKLELMQSNFIQLQQDVNQIRHEMKSNSKEIASKMNDKIKVIYDNQKQLENAVETIQAQDIQILQQKIQDLAGFINKAIVNIQQK